MKILFAISLFSCFFSFQASGQAKEEDIRRYYSEGIFYMLLGKFDSVVFQMDEAIAKYPEQADFYNLRGRSKVVLKDRPGALKDFDMAIELDPEKGEHFYYRGEAWMYAKDYEEALKDFNKGIELNPEFQYGYYFRGRLHTMLGNFDQAISDLNHAEILDARNPAIYKYRGMALLRRDGPEAGCPEMLKAKSLGAGGMEEIIADYCSDLYGGSVMPGGDGWEIYKSPRETDALNAGNINSYENQPGSIVEYFYASRIRGDEKWREVCLPEGDWSGKMKYSLEKYDRWKFTRFHLVSRKSFDQGKYWIKVFFAIEIEDNGKIYRDEGEDEATVELIDGKWVITEVPN